MRAMIIAFSILTSIQSYAHDCSVAVQYEYLNSQQVAAVLQSKGYRPYWTNVWKSNLHGGLLVQIHSTPHMGMDFPNPLYHTAAGGPAELSTSGYYSGPYSATLTRGRRVSASASANDPIEAVSQLPNCSELGN